MEFHQQPLKKDDFFFFFNLSVLPRGEEFSYRFFCLLFFGEDDTDKSQTHVLQPLMVSLSIVVTNNRHVCPQSVCATTEGQCGRCVTPQGAAYAARV